MTYFKKGDQVYIIEKKHACYGRRGEIVDIQSSQYHGALEYTLSVSPCGLLTVLDDQVSYKDPMSPNYQLEIAGITIASGIELDRIGKIYGIERFQGWKGPIEDDIEYRSRLLKYFKNGNVPNTPKVDKHEGHEIIENHAGGKTFKYCRNCKIEVF